MRFLRHAKKRRERLLSGFLAAFLFAGCWLLARGLSIETGGGALRELTFGRTPWAAARVETASPRIAASSEPVQVRAVPAEIDFDPPAARRRAQAAAPLRAAAAPIARRSTAVAALGSVERTNADAPAAVVQRSAAGSASRRKRIRTEPASAPLARKAMPDLESPRTVREVEAEETVEVDAVIEWMRREASELPPGILRHVDYRPGNLTAQAKLDSDGEIFELYLMVRVPVREMHVVLVGERRTWYLIDRSFQQEGRAFRVGTARRTDGVITGVFSEERAASENDAARFYDLFLSWWALERARP